MNYEKVGIYLETKKFDEMVTFYHEKLHFCKSIIRQPQSVNIATLNNGCAQIVIIEQPVDISQGQIFFCLFTSGFESYKKELENDGIEIIRVSDNGSFSVKDPDGNEVGIYPNK